MNASLISDRLERKTAEFLSRTHRLFIDGDWIDAESGQTITVINPATGRVLAEVQAGGPQDIDRAVRAARAAFDEGPWPRLPPSERARLMLKLADAVAGEKEQIAYLETLDNGMPFSS